MALFAKPARMETARFVKMVHARPVELMDPASDVMPEDFVRSSQQIFLLFLQRNAQSESLVLCAKREMATLNASSVTSKAIAARRMLAQRSAFVVEDSKEIGAPITQRSQSVKERSYAKTATLTARAASCAEGALTENALLSQILKKDLERESAVDTAWKTSLRLILKMRTSFLKKKLLRKT